MQSINTRLILNRTEDLKMVEIGSRCHKIPLLIQCVSHSTKKTHDGRPGNTWFFSVKEEGPESRMGHNRETADSVI